MTLQDALKAIKKFTGGPVSCVSLSWGQDEAGWDHKVLMSATLTRRCNACKQRKHSYAHV